MESYSDDVIIGESIDEKMFYGKINYIKIITDEYEKTCDLLNNTTTIKNKENNMSYGFKETSRKCTLEVLVAGNEKDNIEVLLNNKTNSIEINTKNVVKNETDLDLSFKYNIDIPKRYAVDSAKDFRVENGILTVDFHNAEHITAI